MDKSHWTVKAHQGDSCPTLPFGPAHFVPNEEHVAVLGTGSRFDLLRRKDDFLDEGVAALFDLASGKAELLALSFQTGKFTPARATTWLAERGFKPLLFVPNSGSLADAPLAAQIGSAVFRNSTNGV
ncbi:MAG TPA: hypothetical protein VK395_12610 [Gemmataceae bacterium]|nr:hypothetical protein [Gemmataceae bacterium]